MGKEPNWILCWSLKSHSVFLLCSSASHLKSSIKLLIPIGVGDLLREVTRQKSFWLSRYVFLKLGVDGVGDGLCCFGSSVGWFIKGMGLLSDVGSCTFTIFKGSRSSWPSSMKLVEALKPSRTINFLQVLGICDWLEQKGSVSFDRWKGCGMDTCFARHQRMSMPGEAVLYSLNTCNTWLAARSPRPCERRLCYFQCYWKCMVILLRSHFCCHFAVKNAGPAVHPSPVFLFLAQTLWQHQYVEQPSDSLCPKLDSLARLVCRWVKYLI